MNISTSIRKLTQLFVVLFIALSGGLVYWQVVVASQVTSNIHNGRPTLPGNAPIRGRIFDRNGVLLADSEKNANGVYVRHYFDNSLAGLIGYYVPGYPATGIEAQYNDYLSGNAGMTAVNNLMNQTLHRPPVGDDIYLTIDERIQKIVDTHFDDPIPIIPDTTFATDRGSVIVSDPHTGEILAMLSRPTFDPNKIVQTLSANDLTYYNQLAGETVEKPLRERPLQETYPPGSIYKTVTLMAGLDSGKTTLDQPFDQQHAMGPITINGQQIGPVGNNIQGYTFRFPVTTIYGFSHSDNVIFAQVGTETGADTWLDYNKRFKVGQQIPFDLPVTPSSVTNANGQALSENQLAANAFGQGIDQVTPLQMTLFDNAVANDGKLMQPMLLSKISDRNNNLIQSFTATTLSSPISSQTAMQVRQAMYGVTFCGSGLVAGVKINQSPWGIIAKTGTAQVSDTGTIPADAWMITQAPYSVNNPTQLPALTVVAMKENGGEGGNVDGPLASSIYQDIFTQIAPYSKLQAPGVAASTYCCQAKLLQTGPGCA